jgi:hypothetical protein
MDLTSAGAGSAKGSSGSPSKNELALLLSDASGSGPRPQSSGGGNNRPGAAPLTDVERKKRAKQWRPPGPFSRLLDALGFNRERRKREAAAALKIQGALRRHQARQRVKLLVHRRYLKLYDVQTDEYVYKDKLTRYVFDRKPFILPNDEDLPTPRALEAPIGYASDEPIFGTWFHALPNVSSFVSVWAGMPRRTTTWSATGSPS